MPPLHTLHTLGHVQGRRLVIIGVLVVLVALFLLESPGQAQEGCPRAFFILFDKSASMKQEDRLKRSQEALQNVLQAGFFEPGDYVLFAPFYDRIENAIEKRNFNPTSDLPELLSKIAGLEPAPWDPARGIKTFTYYDVALSLLHQKLAELADAPLFSLPVVIFITDGRDERPKGVIEKEYEKFRQIKAGVSKNAL